MTLRLGNTLIAGSGGAVDSVNGQTGEVILTASDVGAVDLTSNQSIGGVKTFTQDIYEVKNSANILLENPDLTKGTAPSANSTIGAIFFYDSTGTSSNRFGGLSMAQYTDKENRIIMGVRSPTAATDASIQIGYKADGTVYTISPASTATNSIVTTTERSVGASSVKFGFGNDLKIATKEVSLTAATDYSWSYGITFSAAPVIFVTRRSGATSTGGVYDAWIRGSAGTSSSKIYCPTAITVELVAIGY